MVLVDTVAGVQDSDKLLMDVLTTKMTPFSLVLTKADKLKKVEEVRPRADKIIEQISEKGLLQLCIPIVHIVSSHTGFGINELRSDLVYIFDQDKL